MSRGFLDEFRGSNNYRDSEDTVSVRVRVEHSTARAIQVSQDAGQSVVWIPRDAVVSAVPERWGPGDTVVFEIPEKLANEKELIE